MDTDVEEGPVELTADIQSQAKKLFRGVTDLLFDVGIRVDLDWDLKAGESMS